MQHVVEELLNLYVTQATAFVVSLQLVQVSVVRQEFGKVLFGAESIQIGENSVAFNLTGILYAYMVRIGVHGHNFLSDILRFIGKINAVAQGFTHLGFAVNAGQTQAGIVLRQHDVRVNQCFAVHGVKLVHDFLTLLQHRQLVLAYRHYGRTEGGDICSLADRIAEEAGRNACFKITHFDFILNGRVTLQTGYSDQVHIVEGQLGQLRHHGLNEKGRFSRIKAAGQIIQRYLDDVLTYLFRMLSVVCKRLGISNHDIYFIICTRILQLYTLAQRAYIVAYMQTSGRTVAGQDNFTHISLTSFCSYIYIIIINALT